METKICRICKEEKPLSSFHTRYSTRNGISKRQGYRTECAECINKARRKERVKNKQKTVYIKAKARAKRLGIPFNLELKDIIVPNKCPILEIELKIGTKGDYMHSPSIDRIIPEKGYIKGNIKIISMLANIMKSSANKELLLKFAKNIENYLN